MRVVAEHQGHVQGLGDRRGRQREEAGRRSMNDVGLELLDHLARLALEVARQAQMRVQGKAEALERGDGVAQKFTGRLGLVVGRRHGDLVAELLEVLELLLEPIRVAADVREGRGLHQESHAQRAFPSARQARGGRAHDVAHAASY